MIFTSICSCKLSRLVLENPISLVPPFYIKYCAYHSIMDETEDLYIVERILARRKNKTGQFEYKIKWKGWSTRQSTWEPRQHLEYVNALVKKYDSNIEKLRKVKMRNKMRASCKKNNRNNEKIEQKDEKVMKQKGTKVVKIDEADEKITEKQQVGKLNEAHILAMKTLQSHDQNKQQNSLAKQRQKAKIKKPKKRIKRAKKSGQEQPMIDVEEQSQNGTIGLKKRKRIRKQRKQKGQRKVKQRKLETTNNVKCENPKKERRRKKRKQLQQADKNEQNQETQRNTKSYQKIKPIIIDLQQKANKDDHLNPQKQEEYDNILQQQFSNIWRHQQLCSNNISSINDAISNVQSIPKNRNFSICKAIDQKIEVVTIKEKAKRNRKPRSFTTPKQDENIQTKTVRSKTIKIAPFIVTIAQSESRSHISQHLFKQSEPSQKQINIEVEQSQQQLQQQQLQAKSKRRRRKKSKKVHSSASQIAEYKMKPKRTRNKRSFAQIFKDNLQIEEWQKNKIRNRVESDDKPQQVQVLSIEEQLKQLKTNMEYKMYMKQDGQLGVEVHDEKFRKCQIDVQELAHHSPAWLKMFYQNYI